MKNKLGIIVVTAILLVVALGCNSINPFAEKSSGSKTPASNKTLTEKGVDTIVGEETTGIPECDQVMDMITAEANNPDDNFITKAAKATVLNKIKESIKKGIEDNKSSNSKQDLAKTCTDFKKQLEKYKTEEEQKK